MGTDALVLGLAEQASAVRQGDVTSEELVDAAMVRVRACDEAVNAVCASYPEVAVEELRRGERGTMHGVPVAVKDMFALPWHAPKEGAPVAPERPGRGGSGVLLALRRAGGLAVLVTNMHQLGLGTTGHISAYGPSRNPWDVGRCAGGSSGGSAAAVAAGYVALGIGTDAAGSIRIPASLCGVVGLKPTWNAVDSTGYTAAFSSMGAIGPITRDVADCRIAAEVLLGRALPRGARQLRIGVPRESLWEDVQPAVRQRCEEALAELRGLGAQVREVTLPRRQHVALAAIVTTGIERLPQITEGWLERVFPTLDPVVRGILKARYRLGADLVHRVARLRTLFRDELAQLFGEVDVIVSPTTPATAPPVERPHLELPSGARPPDPAMLEHAGLANLAGIPAISVPCGVDDDGMPVGLMLQAPWGRESTLLDLAEAFERATGRAHVIGAPVYRSGTVELRDAANVGGVGTAPDRY